MREEQGIWRDRQLYSLPLIRRTYDSMMEYTADAKRGYDDYKRTMAHAGGYAGSAFDEIDFGFSSSFSGVNSWRELEKLARDGWKKPLQETLNLADIAVKYIERFVEQFEPVHDVSGADVDVAAAVAGLPEDMISYPLQLVSNVGSTITVCCDVQCYAGVRPESIMRRGMVIVALALALDQMGHQTELWVSDEYTAGKNRAILRTRVKGPNDYIDPTKVMFAYAHPAVQRGLGFCTVAGLPDPWRKIANQGMGYVTGITKDMPEGTLYIEPMHRNTDSPNLNKELKAYLTALGLLAKDAED